MIAWKKMAPLIAAFVAVGSSASAEVVGEGEYMVACA